MIDLNEYVVGRAAKPPRRGANMSPVRNKPEFEVQYYQSGVAGIIVVSAIPGKNYLQKITLYEIPGYYRRSDGVSIYCLQDAL